MTERLHFHFSLSCIREGNGNPLRCLAWRIPGTGEPGGLPSMGLHRVGHDWSDLAAAAAAHSTLNRKQQYPIWTCYKHCLIPSNDSPLNHSHNTVEAFEGLTNLWRPCWAALWSLYLTNTLFFKTFQLLTCINVLIKVSFIFQRLLNKTESYEQKWLSDVSLFHSLRTKEIKSPFYY